MAFKWADETYETILRSIEWQVGKTGVVTPVAIFDPVDLDGALTSKSTLHNVGIVKELELGIGDTITVYRSNMVIPHVDENLTRSNTIKIPDICPSCGKPLKIRTSDRAEVLICENNECPEKLLNKFVHFVSRDAVNIDGLSEKTLLQLINKGYIKEFRDLYHLTKEQLLTLEGFKDKSAQKLLDAIEASRSIKMANYINAIGINNIGVGLSKDLAKHFHNDFNEFAQACFKGYDFTIIDGFGETINADIYNWLHGFRLDKNLVNEFKMEIEVKQTSNELANLRFCITGSFSQSRDILKEKLESKGAIFVGSVSKKLDILFVGDNAGSKLDKANELGIKIANEEVLLKMLGE